MAKAMKGPVPLQKARAMGDVNATGPTGGGAKPAPMKGAKPGFKYGGKAGKKC